MLRKLLIFALVFVPAAAKACDPVVQSFAEARYGARLHSSYYGGQEFLANEAEIPVYMIDSGVRSFQSFQSFRGFSVQSFAPTVGIYAQTGFPVFRGGPLNASPVIIRSGFGRTRIIIP